MYFLTLSLFHTHFIFLQIFSYIYLYALENIYHLHWCFVAILANLLVWPCTLVLISYIMLLILSLEWNKTTFCHTVDIPLPKYFIPSFNIGAFFLSFGFSCCCCWPISIRLVTISTFSVHVVFSLYEVYMAKTKNQEELHGTHSANLTYYKQLGLLTYFYYCSSGNNCCIVAYIAHYYNIYK